MKKIVLIGVIGLVFVLGGCGKKESSFSTTQEATTKQEASPNNQSKSVLQTTGSPEIVTCAAAAMKSGQGIDLYHIWISALIERYSKSYPDKTDEQLDDYVSERVEDKKKYIESKGILTTDAFLNFYKQNCQNYLK